MEFVDVTSISYLEVSSVKARVEDCRGNSIISKTTTLLGVEHLGRISSQMVYNFALERVARLYSSAREYAPFQECLFQEGIPFE